MIQSDSELAIHVLIVITSRQTNLTQDRIAAADGRFNSIRQLAPMCTHVPPSSAWKYIFELFLGIELYTVTVRSVDVRLSLYLKTKQSLTLKLIAIYTLNVTF